MRPSDTRTRQKKNRLQQARNARGKVWQNDLLDILCGIPKVWCRGWPADYAQPGYPDVRDGGDPHHTPTGSTSEQFADWFAQVTK